MKYYQAVIGGTNLDVPVQLFATDVLGLKKVMFCFRFLVFLSRIVLNLFEF